MNPWYFAHPVSDYGTGCEARVMDVLTKKGLHLENPNQTHHQLGYLDRGLDYFLEDILPMCVGCLFMPFPGGLVGAGVATEVEHFLDLNQHVFEIAPDNGCGLTLLNCHSLEDKRILTRDETRAITKLLRTLPNGGRSYV